MLKRWGLWAPAVYAVLALFGLSDETRILLFVISPPAWITEGQWFVRQISHPANIPIAVIILVSILFWAAAGLLIDAMIKRMKGRKGG